MSEKKSKTNASSSSGGEVKKKPSKFHTKNKKHQQHSSSRSNKHFMITGQMSGTGFRRSIQTVNDNEDVDQEELEMMQQEENLKRAKYGKRSLVDNSFRFKSEEDDEVQTPEAEERKFQAKLQHELNRMEKETMMMISNSVTLTQSFASPGTSRGLLEWEEEKLDSSDADSIMSKLFYLDQSKLATLLKDPSISVERRLKLIDIQPFPSNSSPEENTENVPSSSFVPFSQYLKSKTTQQQQVEDISSDSENDAEPMQEEPSVPTKAPVEQITTQQEQTTEKKQDDSMDILDEIMENEVKHTTFTLPKPKVEPVKIDLKNDDILDDLLSMHPNPSSSSATIPKITSPINPTLPISTQSIPTTSATLPKQTSPENPKTQEKAGDLDDWLDDLIN
ncbi:predicted protein [Naegleria gruberi]|uniref:Predicted protein n=1 Tax=Naegleria gruberi TaxID=5762 RepID=D2VW15_NAEGR|nr:uncharacterized protein NAEGRDRAFT_59375 [Naegleria gruberi]EFC39001.1 predicted protein [Naegleria gruberi]|eukprot:XP_002671745.1 predicted protein [Naegleria gruberi strain NEG-M]